MSASVKANPPLLLCTRPCTYEHLTSMGTICCACSPLPFFASSPALPEPWFRGSKSRALEGFELSFSFRSLATSCIHRRRGHQPSPEPIQEGSPRRIPHRGQTRIVGRPLGEALSLRGNKHAELLAPFARAFPLHREARHGASLRSQDRSAPARQDRACWDWIRRGRLIPVPPLFSQGTASRAARRPGEDAGCR